MSVRQSKLPASRPLVWKPEFLRLSQNSVLLLLILALAAFLRLHNFSALPPALGMDEAMNGNNALENIENKRLLVFYPENFGREGLFINLQTLFVYFMGNTAHALRMPSALIGILTVLGIYKLASELFNKPVGLWTAFFLATSFWHVNFSRIGLRVICGPCFLAWGIYLLLVGSRRVREGKPFVRAMVTAGIVYGLGFYSYIAYRATPLLVLGIFLYELVHARKEIGGARFWRAWGSFAGAAAVVVAPLMVYFLLHPSAFFARAAHLSIFNTAHPVQLLGKNIWLTILMFFTAGDQNWQHNYPGRPQLFWPVAICLLVGVLIALRAMGRQPNRFQYAVSLGAVASGGLPAVLTNADIPDALRSLLMIPGVFVLAGAGAHYLCGMVQRKVPPRVATVALLVAIAALAYEPYHTYFERWGKSPELASHFDIKIVDYARQINALPQELPKYVIATTGGELVNGIPISTQPIMFLTDTYTARGQSVRNVHYLAPEGSGMPPAGTTDMEFCQQRAASLPGGAVFCLLR